jgi:hypothetical protein
MFVCPKCGHALKVRELNDYSVDPETGESNTSIGDYDLTDVLVICTVCGADVTDYFTNEQDELDIDGGVWKLRTEPAKALPNPHCKYCGCDVIEYLGQLGKLFWYKCKRFGCYGEFTMSGPPDEIGG